MTMSADTSIPAPLLGEAGSDPIEDRVRETIRLTIKTMFEEDLAAFLGRIRYGRGVGARKGYRNGRRERQLVGTFGKETVSAPRARIEGEDGKTREWRSKALPRYQRLAKRVEALIAAVYLAGTLLLKRALTEKSGAPRFSACAPPTRSLNSPSPKRWGPQERL